MYAMRQMARNSYTSSLGSFSASNINRQTSFNQTPCLAFAAKSNTSQFISIPEDDLTLQKQMLPIESGTVKVVSQNVDINKSSSSIQEKIGKGMDPEIDAAFSKPVIKVKEISINNPVLKKPTGGQSQGGSGRGGVKKISSARFKFI